MAVEINITDKVTPMIQSVAAALKDGSLENAMGRGATNRVTDHLFKYNATHPNKLGGKRTNFYASAARGTNYRSKPGEVIISINQVGIAQRYFGGTIRPVRRKYLTIPVVPEAHGRRASEFNNLVVAFGAGGQPIGLKEAPATRVKLGPKVKNLGSATGRLFFAFAKEVNQKGDPGVLPTKDEIAAAAVQAGGNLIARAAQKGGA